MYNIGFAYIISMIWSTMLDLLAAADEVAWLLELAVPPDWVVRLGGGGTGGALLFLDPEALELLETCPRQNKIKY